ncbi:MAG: calcium-binding protein [Polyangia bacterium]
MRVQFFIFVTTSLCFPSLLVAEISQSNPVDLATEHFSSQSDFTLSEGPITVDRLAFWTRYFTGSSHHGEQWDGNADARGDICYKSGTVITCDKTSNDLFFVVGKEKQKQNVIACVSNDLQNWSRVGSEVLGDANQLRVVGSSNSEAIYFKRTSEDLSYDCLFDVFWSEEFLSMRKIYGFDGMDYIYGSEEDDYLLGEYIVAYDGNDTIEIIGESHSEFLEAWGGPGEDEILGSDSNDTIVGQNGDDNLYGYGGNDSIYGVDGKDYVEGGYGNDFIAGGELDDILMGMSGDDVIWCDVANDYNEEECDPGLDWDLIYGGVGSDEMYEQCGDGGIDGGGYYGDDYCHGGFNGYFCTGSHCCAGCEGCEMQMNCNCGNWSP